MSKNIVFEGWLTKSPPSKRIWRTKWRRRWFALRQSGELPGQYFLDYYSDRHCRRLKGSIDLDRCDQVDAGLHMERDGNGTLNPKLRGCVFTIQTNIRTYHLEADSEEEMERWVETICRVCGLKASEGSSKKKSGGARKRTHTVTFKNNKSPSSRGKVKLKSALKKSPPGRYDQSTLSPVQYYSNRAGTGPYIPISECITGVRTQDTQTAFTFDPKNILVSRETEVRVTKSYTLNVIQPKATLYQSGCSDDETDLSDEECRSLEAALSLGDSTLLCAKSFKRLSVQDGFNSDGPPVPPRPPKTFTKTKELSKHLRECQGIKFQEPADVHEAASMHYCNISLIPPLVDRALKPRHSVHSTGNTAAGPKPQCSKTSDEIKPEKLQYLDLDLPEPSSKSSDGATALVHGKSAADECAYKTVDFVKTEAFNSTRQDAEASRSVQQ